LSPPTGPSARQSLASWARTVSRRHSGPAKGCRTLRKCQASVFLAMAAINESEVVVTGVHPDSGERILLRIKE
jgi:hypothetical protein